MFVRIAAVLDAAEVVDIVTATTAGEFAPGAATAAGSAASVKDNLQLRAGSDAAASAGERLVDRIRMNPIFEAAAMPRRVSPPRFSRYEKGMRYGDHLDGPLMGLDAGLMRTDLAVTVFLSDPDSYDGGELTIDSGFGLQRCKGAAGDCVVYPASMFHRVETVTRGVRLAAFFWIQSLVRDSARRQILFDLATSIDHCDRAGQQGPWLERLRRSHLNLVRMWSEV